MNINSRIARANFTGYASGSPATFTGLREAPIKIGSYINPIQPGTGDPTPLNIRPISGRDSITITANSVDHEIDLDNTIYVGYLDVDTGLLTVLAKYLEFDAATYYGTYGVDDAPLFYVDITNQGITRMDNSGRSGVLISNMLSKVSASGATRMKNYEIRTDADPNTTRFYFRIDSCTSQDDIDAFFEDKTLQVVASLATPYTIQLSPEEIWQAIGSNSISSDAGNVDVYFVII